MPPPPGCLSLLLRTEYVSSIHRALSLPLLHRGSSPSGLQSKAYEDPGLATNPLLNSLSTGTIRKIPFSLSASNNNHLHSFLQTKFSGFALTERCHSFCCTQDTVAPPEGCLCFLDLWILLGIWFPLSLVSWVQLPVLGPVILGTKDNGLSYLCIFLPHLWDTGWQKHIDF